MFVKAGFLFIKKRFRMNLVLDEYHEAAGKAGIKRPAMPA